MRKTGGRGGKGERENHNGGHSKKYSTIQEDESSEDPFKHLEDMYSNYLRNQMIKLNTARQ